MKIRGHDIGVCSWSLRPTGLADLLQKLHALDLDHVQISLAPLFNMEPGARQDEIKRLRDEGITITSGQISFPGEDYTTIQTIRNTGGVVPSSLWEQRRETAKRAAELAAELGLPGISLHAGFIPQSNDPKYNAILARICEIADPVADAGVNILLETGQETPSELLQFLNDIRATNVGCNYDPANVILYGVGDPIDSVQTLGRHIRHVHVKDAEQSDTPGTHWGRETRLGRGQVPLGQLIEALDEVGYTGPLVIENEFDEDLEGIREAISALQELEQPPVSDLAV